MDKTGAASYLASVVVHWFAPFGILAILGGFFVLTIILTQPMSNAAAALVVLPRGDQRSAPTRRERTHLCHRHHARCVVSFITPFEPSCISSTDRANTGSWTS
jgi:hypothetical protein